ncbi:unnamed protein product, partial [Mucor fragilis]
RRTTGRQYSFLGSWAASSFVPKLPKIPEEESDNESLDIGLERQVHFKTMPLYTRMTASEIKV